MFEQAAEWQKMDCMGGRRFREAGGRAEQNSKKKEMAGGKALLNVVKLLLL